MGKGVLAHFFSDHHDVNREQKLDFAHAAPRITAASVVRFMSVSYI